MASGPMVLGATEAIGFAARIGDSAKVKLLRSGREAGAPVEISSVEACADARRHETQ